MNLIPSLWESSRRGGKNAIRWFVERMLARKFQRASLVAQIRRFDAALDLADAASEEFGCSFETEMPAGVTGIRSKHISVTPRPVDQRFG